jgi:tetratricopeptide (TPR) repeat protein
MFRLLLIALSSAALWVLTPLLATVRPTPEQSLGAVEVMSSRTRQALAFGFRSVLGDWYWLRAIQYYGTRANEDKFYAGLYPLLRHATDLDPHFQYAYVFGGEAIPYHQYNVGWHNTARAIDLLRKGMANDPQRWEIPWLLSYDLYTYVGDYKEAGHVMEIAADLAARGKREDARFAPPTYLRSLAARLLSQGGELETAIDFTRQAVGRAQDEKLKAELEDRLNSLQLELDLRRLNAALDLGRKKGMAIQSVSELKSSNEEPLKTTDPFGDAYELDPANGQVVSKNANRLLRLYISPTESAPGERAVD